MNLLRHLEFTSGIAKTNLYGNEFLLNSWKYLSKIIQKRSVDKSIFFFNLNIDVVQEKIHQNIVTGVEAFDKTALHHTETKEKAVLPSTEGTVLN